jgi:Tfp pilus assembly protein PilE
VATNTVILIVVAVVVVLALIALLAFVGRGMRDRKHRVEADRIRDEVREESSRLEKREAIATETEAKARAAQAEAEAKAAEAARLQGRAGVHRDNVDSSREHLDAKREHADALDPRKTPDNRKTDEAVDENQNGDRTEQPRTVR